MAVRMDVFSCGRLIPICKYDIHKLLNLYPSSPITILQESPGGHKKKIITVGSDFESSPSPEETPSPPLSARKNKGIDYSRELEAINKVIGVRNEQENNEKTQPPVSGRPPFKSDSFKYDSKPNRDFDGDDNHRNSSEKLTLSQKHKKLAGNKWKNSLSKSSVILLNYQHSLHLFNANLSVNMLNRYITTFSFRPAPCT